jgi:hypothetical protein
MHLKISCSKAASAKWAKNVHKKSIELELELAVSALQDTKLRDKM